MIARSAAAAQGRQYSGDQEVPKARVSQQQPMQQSRATKHCPVRGLPAATQAAKQGYQAVPTKGLPAATQAAKQGYQAVPTKGLPAATQAPMQGYQVVPHLGFTSRKPSSKVGRVTSSNTGSKTASDMQNKSRAVRTPYRVPINRLSYSAGRWAFHLPHGGRNLKGLLPNRQSM